MNKRRILCLISITAVVICVTVVLGIKLQFSETIIAACIEGGAGIVGVIISIIAEQFKKSSKLPKRKITVSGDDIEVENVIGGDMAKNSEKISETLHNSEINVVSNRGKIGNIVAGNHIEND